MTAERVLPASADWLPCQATPEGTPGCIGSQLDTGRPCFAHTDKDGRTARLKQLRDGGPLDFVQGVEFTKELLAEVLEVAPTKDGRSVLKDAHFEAVSFQGPAVFEGVGFQGLAVFDGATFQSRAGFEQASFQDGAWFVGVRFQGLVVFEGASFQGNTWFDRARFQARTWFDRARFEGDARFERARFERDARFDRVRVQDNTWFDGTSFHGDAWFGGTRFQGDARFERVSFQGNSWFDGASFHGDARFKRTRFQGDARFKGTRFQHDAKFDEATFEQPAELGPVRVGGTLSLDRIVFTEPLQVDATAARLSCQRTRFPAGGQLRIADADITLEGAEAPAPLIVAGPPPSELSGHRSPVVLSVQRADVAKLTLTDLDLRPCRFAGAHHLDQLSLNTTDAFHRAPARAGHGRLVLAEECTWRRGRAGRNAQRWPDVGHSDELEPAALAALYRQLRKGREDAKNEPGAADFYYGECEMRRHASGTPWAERAILTAYWLISGYGLRSTRALLTLLGVVLTTVVLLIVYGLPQDPAAQVAGTLQGRVADGQTLTVQLAPPGNPALQTTPIIDRWSWERFEKASRVAVNAVVFRSAEQQLTRPGRYIEMAARFLGPVLLALTLLAVRNRVKR